MKEYRTFHNAPLVKAGTTHQNCLWAHPKTLQDGHAMGGSRYAIDDPQTMYFFTCTTVNCLPVFKRSAKLNIVLDSFRYRQSERRMNGYGQVIL